MHPPHYKILGVLRTLKSPFAAAKKSNHLTVVAVISRSWRNQLRRNAASQSHWSETRQDKLSKGGLGAANSLQGMGWQEGEVKQRLSELISKHKGVLTKPSYKYNGPPIGKEPLRTVSLTE